MAEKIEHFHVSGPSPEPRIKEIYASLEKEFCSINSNPCPFGGDSLAVDLFSESNQARQAAHAERQEILKWSKKRSSTRARIPSRSF